MRTLIAAIAFAVIVAAAFAWRLTQAPREALPAPANGVASAPHMGPLEQATNRQGRDLSDIGLRVSDAAACARQCGIDERCVAMSFVKGADASSGICWLKGSVPGPSENAAVVSALKVFPDK